MPRRRLSWYIQCTSHGQVAEKWIFTLRNDIFHTETDTVTLTTDFEFLFFTFQVRYLLRDSAPIAEAKEQMRKYNKMAKKTADKAKKKKEKSPVEVSFISNK